MTTPRWTPPTYFQQQFGDDARFAPGAWEIPEDHPSQRLLDAKPDPLADAARAGADRERARVMGLRNFCFGNLYEHGGWADALQKFDGMLLRGEHAPEPRPRQRRRSKRTA